MNRAAGEIPVDGGRGGSALFGVILKPEQQKYAELVALGENPAAAYGMAFGGGEPMKPDAKRKGVSRMSQNVPVQDEIRRIRAEAEKMLGGVVMSLAQKRIYLNRIMTTPLSEIGADSVLCSELTISKPYKKDGEQQMELWEVEKIRKPDPLRAMEIDAKLAGEFSDDRKNDAEAAAAQESMHYMAELRKRKGA